jgi:hypothetical protein
MAGSFDVRILTDQSEAGSFEVRLLTDQPKVGTLMSGYSQIDLRQDHLILGYW